MPNVFLRVKKIFEKNIIITLFWYNPSTVVHKFKLHGESPVISAFCKTRLRSVDSVMPEDGIIDSLMPQSHCLKTRGQRCLRGATGSPVLSFSESHIDEPLISSF